MRQLGLQAQFNTFRGSVRPESGEREPMGLRSQLQLWFGSESRLHQQNYRAEMQSGT